MKRFWIRTPVRVVAVGITSSLLLTACGSSGGTSGQAAPGGGSAASGASSSSSSTALGKDDAIAAMVPASIRSSGKLTIATEGAYAPFELFASDNKTLIGVDPELGTALAQVMGLKANLVNVKFDSIIPGLQAKRYDVGMAAFGDTKVREKVVDFVTYFKGGSSLLVPAGNPKKLTLETLCGHKVAVEKGSIYESSVIPDLTATCKSAGKGAISTEVFPGQPEATLAVSSGRVEATISDFAPMAYTAKQSNGKFDVLPEQYKPIPWGIAMPKDSGLAQAMLAAVKKIMSQGAYQQILQKWDVTSGAITDPAINAAIA